MFGKNFKGVTFAEAKKQLDEKEAQTKKTKEEWIWVEGYKGTDENMMCRDCLPSKDKQFINNVKKAIRKVNKKEKQDDRY